MSGARDGVLVDSQTNSRTAAWLPGLRPIAVMFLGFWGLAATLQFAGNAFRAEFNGYPDEAAHFVTLTMVREYIAQGFPTRPFAFAENYYLHYPKVGFGHWPPFFYVCSALWSFPAPHSRAWILAFMALITAATASLVSASLLRAHGWMAAAAIGASFVLVPAVQRETSMVMLETLLALTSFCAAWCFAAYLRSGRALDSLGFGFFASLAILTKGDGWALGLLPLFAILFSRRWKMLQGASFWIAAVPVAILCLPWQFYTLHMTGQGWDQPNPTISYFLSALLRFAGILFRISPVLFILGLVGVAQTVARPFLAGRPVNPLYAAMSALLLSVWLFHSFVPAGVEERRMIMGWAGLIVFVPEGFGFVARLSDRILPVGRWRRLVQGAMAAGLFFACGFAIPVKESYGFSQAAKELLTRSDLRDPVCLVSSNDNGEGMLVSEVALLRPRPERFFLRATKVLSKTDWAGTDYHSFFHSPGEVARALDQLSVGILVLDLNPGQYNFEHHRLIGEMVRDNPGLWKLAGIIRPGTHGDPASGVAIYRRAGATPGAGRIQLDLSGVLNRTLEGNVGKDAKPRP